MSNSSDRRDLTFTRWMARQPQPARVKCISGDNDPVEVEVCGTGRGRWREVEESVLAEKPERVQALDKDGRVLRSFTMPEAVVEKHLLEKGSASSAQDYKGQAAIIRAIAETHNDAFDRGREAAGESAAALTDLVGVLVQSLNAAIIQQHNMAVNLGNLLMGKDEGEGTVNQSSEAMQRLILTLGAKFLSDGAPGKPSAPPAPNGGKKP